MTKKRRRESDLDRRVRASKVTFSWPTYEARIVADQLAFIEKLIERWRGQALFCREERDRMWIAQKRSAFKARAKSRGQRP